VVTEGSRVFGRGSRRACLVLRGGRQWLREIDRDSEAGVGVGITTPYTGGSRRLRDRFSSNDLQFMIEFYGSEATAKQVAEKFGVSLRSVKRLLRERDVRRERRTAHT
jgi:hypothetical protein